MHKQLQIPRKVIERIFAKKEISIEQREEYETVYILIALGLLVGSLLIGMIKGYTSLWILLSLLSLFFIYKAFPDVWKFSFYIVLIYFFGGFGGFFLVREEILYYIIGIIFEIVAIFFIFSFRRKVILLRDELRKEVPIGIWFLSLFLFFGLSNLSLIDISFWIDKKFAEFPYMTIYMSIEIVLILLSLYFLLFLQRKVVRGKVAVKKIVYEKCPVCKTDIVKEIRKCPNCNDREEVYWCLVGEHYVINCKNCNEKTVVGRSCINCSKEVAKELTCESCKKCFPISLWLKS